MTNEKLLKEVIQEWDDQPKAKASKPKAKASEPITTPMTKLEAHFLRRLAVEASVDPRSIQRVLEGKPVRGMSGQRIIEVLKKHGLLT